MELQVGRFVWRFSLDWVIFIIFPDESGGWRI